VVTDVVAHGDGNSNVCEDEKKDSSDDFFDAGEGVVILSLRAASESGQSGSGGGTEDDPSVP
jgi:hypothetical protein